MTEPRTATLRTDHGTPTHAEWVAAAVAPDNTDSMATEVTGATVNTEIKRETTGGLGTTVDDYIVNLGVATSVIDAVGDKPTADGGSAHDAVDSGSTHDTGDDRTADQPTDNRHQHE